MMEALSKIAQQESFRFFSFLGRLSYIYIYLFMSQEPGSENNRTPSYPRDVHRHVHARIFFFKNEGKTDVLYEMAHPKHISKRPNGRKIQLLGKGLNLVSHP